DVIRHLISLTIFSLLPPPQPRSTLFPYTTLFRSEDAIVRNTRDLKKSLLRRLFTHGLRGEPLKETEIGPLPESWEARNLASVARSEEHTSELQSRFDLVCRLLLEKKKKKQTTIPH